MMILPLADALQNCFQNLTSRIAGVDNERMSNRVIGLGAMLGFGIGAITEQFKVPKYSKNSNNSNDNNSGGIRGFVTRARSIISPKMVLSSEKDYNGNTNPIRQVVEKENISQENNQTEGNNNGKKIRTIKNIAKVSGTVAKTGIKVAKVYTKMGASLVEGNFDNDLYIRNLHKRRNKNNNYQKIEYVKQGESEKNNQQEKQKEEQEKGDKK